KNYLEITRLMQGYVVNEGVLSKGHRCYGNCEMYIETAIKNCLNDGYCRKQRQCNGNVYNCRSLATMDMDICPSVDPNRRYSYIEYQNHTTLGPKSTCPVPTARLDSWIGSCPYCICSCDDEGRYSDRYISLKDAVSDTNANKVVTGVRFVKRNGIIHLQVQQGELLPHAIINATTLEWVPIQNFKMTDRYIYDKQDYIKLGRRKNAVDLHVKEVENGDRAFPKRVITGLGFFVLRTQANTHLNLQIRETAFDFETGKLYPNSNQWTRNLQTVYSPTNRRTPIYIEDVDVPTKANAENVVRSNGVQYIEFTQTSLKKDAAQTTVPFIDTQDVVPSAPTPLVGAGVYYKAAEGYGGFIGLKIITYDFVQHL
ncbi:hypothetical protein Trydic_g19487, partial [Trypoxylus dichotomus]